MGNTTIFSGCVSAVTIKNSGLFQITDPRVEEISTALSENINQKVIIDGVSAQTLSATHISQDDFYQRASASALLSNELYIVSSDYINAYGQQLKNLSAGTDLSDAVTLEQLQATSSSLSNVLSNYYVKSETSSTTELTSAFANKLEANDVNISYDSTARKIVLQSKTHATSVDCNDFIKDGMLSSAELCGTTLVLKFNTDAGSNPISVELSNFVDDYDGKITYLSNALSSKADLSSIEHVVQYEQDEYGIYTGVTIGSRLDGYDIGERSFVQGTDCIADHSKSHAEGYKTVAYNDDAHAEGNETSATGYWSHSEGRATLATNYSAHAEGSYTSAFGDTSHSEGFATIANNDGTHAEGGYTSAFGYYSHTEGGWTSTGANAMGAHAEGGFTRADGPISHVEGVKATSELSDYQSFVWQGTNVMPNELTDITPSTWDEYKAHGPGTFNINPVSGAAGVYIGEQTLDSMLCSNKVFIDDHISSSAGYSDLSVVKLSASEYEELVSTSAVLSNALYVVEGAFENAYGYQIKNLAPGTDLSDAVNLEQLSNAMSNVQIPTDLSSFTNSPGYTKNVGTITGITMNGASKGTAGVVNLGTVLTAHQSLANYYTKSEVSSKTEVANEFSNKAQKKLPAIKYSGSLPVGSNNPVISFTELSTSNNLVLFACDQYPRIKLNFDTSSNKAQLIHYSGVINYLAEAAGTPASTQLTFNISSDRYFPTGTNGELVLTKNIVSVDVAYEPDIPHVVLDTITNMQEQIGLGSKITIVDQISNITATTNELSVVKISASDYEDLVANDATLSNCIYDVENDYVDVYGEQIKNVAPPTDLSDAATKEYVDNALTNVQVPTDLSAFTNSPGYTTNAGTITGIMMNGVSKGTSGNVNLGTVLTAHQSLANYYQKSETSSAIEIATAFENAGGGSSRYALVTAQLVSDNGSLTCAVDDQTITTIQVSSSATPIVVQLPAQPEDGARDFILRIEISSSAAPTFTFNGVNETIDFDSEDDDWAVMEPGLNLVSFTETKRGN